MGQLMKIKCVDSRVNVTILASTSVQFTPRMVQVPNLILSHTKRITVWSVKPVFKPMIKPVLRLFFKLFFMGVYICCMGVQTCDGVRICFMGFKPFSWVFKPQALLSESCELVLNLALAPIERK
jgi:hypothetical protein